MMKDVVQRYIDKVSEVYKELYPSLEDDNCKSLAEEAYKAVQKAGWLMMDEEAEFWYGKNEKSNGEGFENA